MSIPANTATESHNIRHHAAPHSARRTRLIYYSEFSKTNKRCEQRAYQRLFGNNDLFDRYRNKVDDAFFFATVSALADEYKRDSDDDEEITKARENVERRFGPLFDASLIEDLLHYYDMYRP